MVSFRCGSYFVIQDLSIFRFVSCDPQCGQGNLSLTVPSSLFTAESQNTTSPRHSWQTKTSDHTVYFIFPVRPSECLVSNIHVHSFSTSFKMRLASFSKAVTSNGVL